MRIELRTFIVPDNDGDECQRDVTAFLRTVSVQRIDSAYTDGAWHLLVLYQDLRIEEESAQIRTAIAHAVHGWRKRVATGLDVTPEMILSDKTINEIAAHAPTTVRELALYLPRGGGPAAERAAEIVDVVKETMALLAG